MTSIIGVGDETPPVATVASIFDAKRAMCRVHPITRKPDTLEISVHLEDVITPERRAFH